MTHINNLYPIIDPIFGWTLTPDKKIDHEFGISSKGFVKYSPPSDKNKIFIVILGGIN